MSRLKNSDPPISLFSFQDIITSLTGVLFLVMILLALFLCSSFEASPQRAAAEAVSASSRELTAEMQMAQRRLAELRKLLAQQGGAERAALAARLQELQKLQKELDAANALQRREAEEAARQLAAAKQLLADQLRRSRMLQKQLDEMQKRLQELRARQQKSEEKLRLSRTVQKFRLVSSDQGTPFFLLLKKSSITFSDPVSGESRTFDCTADPEWRALEGVLTAKLSDSRFLLFFVQPGAFPYYERFEEKCRKCGWTRFGAEVLPDDQTEIQVEGGTK